MTSPGPTPAALSVEDRLAMARIPWRTFTSAELDVITLHALRGRPKLLAALRREVRRRDRMPRS